MIDFAAEPLDVGVGDPEAALREVADDPDDALLVDPPAVAELGQPPLRALADEHVDRPLALEQQLDEVTADEARCAGDEVRHLSSSEVFANRSGPYTATAVWSGSAMLLESPAKREYGPS